MTGPPPSPTPFPSPPLSRSGLASPPMVTMSVRGTITSRTSVWLRSKTDWRSSRSFSSRTTDCETRSTMTASWSSLTCSDSSGLASRSRTVREAIAVTAAAGPEIRPRVWMGLRRPTPVGEATAMRAVTHARIPAKARAASHHVDTTPARARVRNRAAKAAKTMRRKTRPAMAAWRRATRKEMRLAPRAPEASASTASSRVTRPSAAPPAEHRASRAKERTAPTISGPTGMSEAFMSQSARGPPGRRAAGRGRSAGACAGGRTSPCARPPGRGRSPADAGCRA